MSRWHNHLDPGVTKAPIGPEEERQIFQAQRVYGNKWAEIAKLLPGRPDNVVKNHFYSTLRRQLRKVLRSVKGEDAKCPNEVSVGYMHSLMKENNVPYSSLDNENVRELIVHLDSHPESAATATALVEETKDRPRSHDQSGYSLYFFDTTMGRRRTTRKKLEKDYVFGSPINSEDESAAAGKRPKTRRTVGEKCRPQAKEIPQRLFAVPSEGRMRGYKVITKESMEDTDLLVNLYNKIVLAVL